MFFLNDTGVEYSPSILLYFCFTLLLSIDGATHQLDMKMEINLWNTLVFMPFLHHIIDRASTSTFEFIFSEHKDLLLFIIL